jgi:hypothetical protein
MPKASSPTLKVKVQMRLSKPLLLASLGVLFATAACTLITDVDRSKIPDGVGGSPSSNGGDGSTPEPGDGGTPSSNGGQPGGGTAGTAGQGGQGESSAGVGGELGLAGDTSSGGASGGAPADGGAGGVAQLGGAGAGGTP